MIKFKTMITPVLVSQFNVSFDILREIQIDGRQFILEKRRADMFDLNPLYDISRESHIELDDLKKQLLDGNPIYTEKDYADSHYIQLGIGDSSILVIVFKGTRITDIAGIESYYLEDKEAFEDKVKRLSNIQNEQDI